MKIRIQYFVPLLVAGLVATGCAGLPGLPLDPGEQPVTPVETGPEETDEPAPGGQPGAVAVPLITLAAHGPGEPGTIGPRCAADVATSALDLTRLTPPAGWKVRETSGGTDSGGVTFDVDGARVVLAIANDERSVQLIDGLALGPEVGQADLAGTPVPVVEATTSDGEGFAIDDVVYLTRLPRDYNGGELELTATVTSTTPGQPSLADATALLSSIRVERCGAITAAMIATSIAGVQAVPEIADDPLGKTYPAGEQPPLDYTNPWTAYSVEQLAYLLPFPEPVDRCVAEALHASVPPDLLFFPLDFTLERRGEPTYLAELAASC